MRPVRSLGAVALVALVCAGACGGPGPSTGGSDADQSRQPGSSAGAARRPPDVYVPPGHDSRVPLPLVILLHGYQSSSDKVERYFDLQPAAARIGFIYVRPNGSKDRSGDQFWNATDACCDLTGTGVDDSAYLAQLIADLEARYPVDPRRVYLVGHSNGGFMAYRMACDHADRIAAIVSLAGATIADPRRCTPSTAVSVLEVHGTADDLIAYTGGSIRGHQFPAATVTVKDWARLDRCATDPIRQPALDLIEQPDVRSSAPPLSGAETSVLAYPRCAATTTVELWTIRGGGHIPGLTPRFTAEVIDFLLAHPKP